MNLPKAIVSKPQCEISLDDIPNLASFDDMVWVAENFGASRIYQIFGVSPYLLTQDKVQILRFMKANLH